MLILFMTLSLNSTVRGLFLYSYFSFCKCRQTSGLEKKNIIYSKASPFLLILLFSSILNVHSMLFFMQAIYYEYNGDKQRALENYIGCANWQRAHSIFMTSIAHALFLNGKCL